MDLGGSPGTAVYAAFEGHVTVFQPHIPAQDPPVTGMDHNGVYGAQIFMRYPNDKMGGFYTHIKDVPAGFGVGSLVARGDFLGNVIKVIRIKNPDNTFETITLTAPHVHLALVEIIGSQKVGVNLYQLFLDLETIYAENYVPVRFMEDGTPPEPQWSRKKNYVPVAGRRQDTGYASKPPEQTSREYQLH